MKDSQALSSASAKSRSNEPATFRLVIRAEIIPEEAPPTVDPRLHTRSIVLTLAGVAVLGALGWIGMSVFGTDSPSARKVSEPVQGVEQRASATPSTPSKAAPPVIASSSTTTSIAPNTLADAVSNQVSSSETNSGELAAHAQPDASPTPIEEAIPDVPRSALQTIRGTVRVSVRVTINQQGAVIAAASVDPGPSRYFERLALEASSEWKFVPATKDEQRNALVRFDFTRAGATARVDTLR